MNAQDSPPDGPRPLSPRWWFENRRTGGITIAQAPNWPLYALGAVWVARRVVEADAADQVLSAAWVALWIYWGGDELIRGVNPWRRVLGAGVVAWQLVGLVR